MQDLVDHPSDIIDVFVSALMAGQSVA